MRRHDRTLELGDMSHKRKEKLGDEDITTVARQCFSCNETQTVSESRQFRCLPMSSPTERITEAA